MNEPLLAALAANDQAAIRRLGWWELLHDLNEWFPKEFGNADALPYARLLGDTPPDAIRLAIVACAATRMWRPTPAELATLVAVGPLNDPRERRPRPDLESSTLAKVRMIFESGKKECDCPPAHNYIMAPGGIIRCDDCGGLDPGQVDNALDL